MFAGLPPKADIDHNVRRGGDGAVGFAARVVGTSHKLADIQRDAVENGNNSYILKVPHQLRQVNENAYHPQLVSIGPYHRGNPHLEEMEVYKKRCLNWIYAKKGKELLDTYFGDNKHIERVKQCYSPTLVVPESQMETFKEMIKHDGCFIVVLLCKKAEEIDPIFKLKWVRNALFHDILLLENQLPFFVLVDLYNMIKDNTTDGEDFASQAFSILADFLPGPKNWIKNNPIIKDTDKIKHLLSLVHDNWLPSALGIKRHQDYNRTKIEDQTNREESREEGGDKTWKFTLCSVEKAQEKVFQGDEESGCFGWKLTCCTRNDGNRTRGRLEWQSIMCATELEEAGVKFMKINGNSTAKDGNVNSLFDVSFTNSTMKIPTFVIDDYTEKLLRNLIAYELYAEGPTHVIDYVTLMDNLINTAKDVQLLRFNGIVENLLGDDEAVAQMMNKLRDHVTLCGDTFYYEEIFVDVKEHCARRWNLLRAKLMHDYFGTPWAPISFVAASILFFITIAQLILSIVNNNW